MNHTDTSVPDSLAAIAAFLDGEHVASAALKEALSTVEGRDYLVDVLALRQAAAGMGPVSFPVPATAKRSSLRWSVAAAIVFAASVAGFVAGGRAGTSTRASAVPTRVEAVIDVSAPERAPEPTQVIRLEPGGRWTGPTRN